MDNDNLKRYEGEGMSIEEAKRVAAFDAVPDHVMNYMAMLDSVVAQDMLDNLVDDLYRRFDEGQASAAVLAQLPTGPTEH